MSLSDEEHFLYLNGLAGFEAVEVYAARELAPVEGNGVLPGCLLLVNKRRHLFSKEIEYPEPDMRSACCGDFGRDRERNFRLWIERIRKILIQSG